jgi:YHS domain-containing protein
MKPILVLVGLLISLTAIGQADQGARRRNFNTENYVALRQFDPVSYFKGKPLKGSEKIQHDHKGITYYFASEANRDEFKKTPEKFEPAYGGWCAYTVATSGDRVKVDPTAYKIVAGRLFLFHNFNGDNRLLKWNNATNKKTLITNADKKWKLR